MVRGREWGQQVVNIVIGKYWRYGQNCQLIAEHLAPSGPSERSVREILERFRNGVLSCGRPRKRRRDIALQGAEKMMFLRVVLNNPLSFLDEFASGIQYMLISRKKLSNATISNTLRDAGITRRKLFKISLYYFEWKRIMYWVRYQNSFTIDMMLFTDESGLEQSDTVREFNWHWRGQRSTTRHIYVSGKRFTMIPLMSVYGVIAWDIIEPPDQMPGYHDVRGTDTDQFKLFLKKKVIPHMNPYPYPHSVLCMDRASIHGHPDIIEMVHRIGARIAFTAAGASQDQPTEPLHGWTKAWVKRNMIWSEIVGVRRAIDTAYKCLPDYYARNVIEHCGY
jgi:hypothetical protein